MAYGTSKDLAFAYANRSATYLVLKMHDECLLNIKWAREKGYPGEKIQKLNEREEKCIKLKKTEVKDPEEDDPLNFFKLSYPSNPKIPFVVDCVELRETGKYGRGIFAKKDLKAGDVIALEEPV